jgi:hypothetical protein
MGGVPGLGFDRRYPFIPGDYRHESCRKKTPEAKRKMKVKCRYYRPRSQDYYISVLYTMINTQTIG